MLKAIVNSPVRSGDQTIVNGNLVIGTAGKGIDFSATSGAGTSELLADYEEGTWTPTFVPSGVGFDAIAYDAATGGRYTKVGNVVHVQAWLQTTSTTLGSASGVLRVGGFPFTSVANTGSTLDGYSALAISISASFVTADAQNMHIRPNATVADMYFQTSVQTGPSSQLVVANMGAGSVVMQFSGTYVAA